MTLQIRENRLLNRCGQHLSEFLILFLAVSVAFIGTRLYLRRGVNATLKHIEMQLNEAVQAGPSSGGCVVADCISTRDSCRQTCAGSGTLTPEGAIACCRICMGSTACVACRDLCGG
jgi:hypothetical protein